MHAYLIAGNDSVKIENKILSLSKQLSGNKPLEFFITKISGIRELNSFLSLKQPEKTIILLRNIESATTDALNAFLKNLEEPQLNVTFILTTFSEYKVMPTILSRCQVIRITNSKLEITKDAPNNFLNLPTGDKFNYVDKIRKREEAVEFVNNTIITAHQNLLRNNDQPTKNAHYLKCLQNTLDALNQNGNVTMQLTNLVVKLDN